jgi:hypothetical protein
MSRRGLIRAIAAVIPLAVVAVACADDKPGPSDPQSAALAGLLATPSAGGPRTIGDDRIEVWVCHVPPDSTAIMFGGLPLRLPLTPQGVTDVVSARVPAYFDELSHGQYRPVFSAGGEVTLAAGDEPQVCVDAAIAAAAPETDAVLVVADAEDANDQPGGFGSGGNPCPAGRACSVATTRRAAYVGASDFHPDWGNEPPMDLVEHEIGHTLGWVHSGVDEVGAYLSGLDVMSNSAAPREVDDTRRDAPGTLAINLFLAGWLPASDVVVATQAAEATLSPSTGGSGTRLLLLDDGNGLLYSVELLTADGLNDHLAADGIAVHRLQIVDGVISSIAPMIGAAPFTALLQPGTDVLGGWELSVADDWTVTVRPSASP